MDAALATALIAELKAERDGIDAVIRFFTERYLEETPRKIERVAAGKIRAGDFVVSNPDGTVKGARKARAPKKAKPSKPVPVPGLKTHHCRRCKGAYKTDNWKEKLCPDCKRKKPGAFEDVPLAAGTMGR
jgi:hypothetical protein